MAKNKKKEIKELESSLEQKGIHLVNFARESQAPIVSERIQKQKEWVFFGEDNLFPNELIRLKDNSALHSAILDTKIKMIAGEGLRFEGDGAEQAEEFFKEAVLDQNDFLYRLASDTALFDSFYLNVQFNKGKEIGTVRHLDYSYMRASKMTAEKRWVDSYWFTTRWDMATTKRSWSNDDLIYKPIEMLGFDPKMMRDSLSREHGQVMVAKRYNPGKLYYSQPTYLGAVDYIEIAGKISRFHKSQLDNGMTGNLHIHMIGDLSNKEKRLKVLQGLQDQYAGTNNAGRIFLTYSTTEAGKPTVEPINTSDVHGALSDLNERVNQEIVSGHNIPRILAGVDVNTGFGGLDMGAASDNFQVMEISPKQKMITSKLDEILRFNNIDATTSIEKLASPALMLDTEIMKLIMTKNEARDKANLEESEEDGEMLLIDIENQSTNGTGSVTDNEERQGTNE